MKTRLTWLRFSVVKATGLAFIVLIAAYLLSMFTMDQAIRSLTPLIYDARIEDSLDQGLFRIKRENDLQRELLLFMLQENFADKPEVSKEDLKNYLAKLDMPNSSLLGMITIDINSPNERRIEWRDDTTLIVLNLKVNVPLDAVKAQFDEVKLIKQRYQLIRGTWQEQISPTLVSFHIIVLLSSFFIVAGVLFVIVQRYRRRVISLLSGFSTWSDNNPDFRFKEKEFKDELKLIAEQFNQMADEVAINRQKTMYLEKMSSWQTMAKKMAHEIKNPLTPIKMMVSHLVTSYNGDNEKYQKILEDSREIVVDEVNSLRRMVDSFSKFAELPTAELTQTDLVAVCQHVVTMQDVNATDRTIRWHTELEEAFVLGDAELLRRVLLNLVKNALEADDESEVMVSLFSADKSFKLMVEDNGPGISDALLPRIFEAYFTTKHTGKDHGMGLGLAICKKIILDHSGDLTVNSKPGQTVFTINIPKI